MAAHTLKIEVEPEQAAERRGARLFAVQVAGFVALFAAATALLAMI